MTTPGRYAREVARLDDLTRPPPVVVAAESWDGVAVDEVDRGLERWAWGLTGFGREAAVRAGLAALEAVLPVWDAAAAAPSDGMQSSLDNIARGFDPSPHQLRDRIAAWLAAPGAEPAAAVAAIDQGDALAIFDVLGNPEFQAYWHDTWMFVLPAAYAAGMLVFDDEALLARNLGNVAIAARRALAGERGDDAPLAVWQIMAGAFGAA